MNNNEMGYRVISIDADNNRMFVTRKPVINKDNDDEKIMRIENHMLDVEFSELPIINLDFRASKCEIVDVSDWKHESYEQLLTMISNYESPSKKR